MSFKQTKFGSYVVGQVWGSHGANHYLLDQVRGRWDFAESKKQVLRLSGKWPKVTIKLVEDAANGPAIISSLRETVQGLIPVRAKDSKIARLSAAAPVFEAGNVWLPHPTIAPWIVGLIEELVMFPTGQNDDQVDALAQALNRFRANPVRSITVPTSDVRVSPWIL